MSSESRHSVFLPVNNGDSGSLGAKLSWIDVIFSKILS